MSPITIEFMLFGPIEVWQVLMAVVAVLVILWIYRFIVRMVLG